MKTVDNKNVPPSWHRMGFSQKAGYLCASHQARDYSHACQILRARGRKKAALIRTPQNFWWNY